MTSLPEQWEARQDLFRSLDESMTALKFLDFEISDDISQQDQAVKMLTYLNDLVKHQAEIINYLWVPYEDEEIVSAAEAVTAASMGGVDCPDPIPNPNGDGTMVTEADFHDTYFWGRKNLILHLTQHSNWRIACRAGEGSNGGVNLVNAVKAAVGGVKIEQNLYWDRSTNVAASVYGPPYIPEDDYPSGPLIQKVLTVFDRANEKALLAYKGYVQLMNIKREARRYTDLNNLTRPEDLPIGPRTRVSRQKLWAVDPTNQFKPPRPSAEFMDFTIEDTLGTGKGNSTGAPTKDEMDEFQKTFKYKKLIAGKSLSHRSRALSGYDWRVAYSPDGRVVNRNKAKFLVDLAKKQRMVAEQQVKADEVVRRAEQQNNRMGMRAADLESRDYEADIAKQEKIAEQREKERWYKKVQDDARDQMAKEDKRTIELMAKEDQRIIELMNERRAKEQAKAAELEAEEIARRKAQSEAAKAANAVKVAREAQEKADRLAQEKAEREAKREAAKAKKKAKKVTAKAKKKAKKDDDFDAALAEFAAKEDAPTTADGSSGSDSDSGSGSESDEENT